MCILFAKSIPTTRINAKCLPLEEQKYIFEVCEGFFLLLKKNQAVLARHKCKKSKNWDNFRAEKNRPKIAFLDAQTQNLLSSSPGPKQTGFCVFATRLGTFFSSQKRTQFSKWRTLRQLQKCKGRRPFEFRGQRPNAERQTVQRLEVREDPGLTAFKGLKGRFVGEKSRKQGRKPTVNAACFDGQLLGAAVFRRDRDGEKMSDGL